MKKIIKLMIIIAALFGAFFFVRSMASTGLKDDMLAAVNLMELTAQERDETRRLIEAAHEEVFAETVRLDKGGIKLDATTYADAVLTICIELAEEQGHSELAEKLRTEKELLTFEVVDQ